jgi:hypothetical protein
VAPASSGPAIVDAAPASLACLPRLLQTFPHMTSDSFNRTRNESILVRKINFWQFYKNPSKIILFSTAKKTRRKLTYFWRHDAGRQK